MFGFSLNASDAKRIAWTGLMAFVAVFIPLATGASNFRNYDQAKAAALALLPAAIAAALSALKNAALDDSSPIK